MDDVLTAIDFSDRSAEVLRVAGRLARATGGTVHLVHAAAEEPALVGYDPEDDLGDFRPEDRARELLEEHAELRDLAAELAATGLQVRPRLVVGPTVEVLLDEADRLHVGWIVVGSHGHGGLRNLLLGSVSEGLVRHADRPVVVVPARTDD